MMQCTLRLLPSTVLPAIAEFEREMLRERVRSGMAAAKAHGKHVKKEAYPNGHPGQDQAPLALSGSGLSGGRGPDVDAFPGRSSTRVSRLGVPGNMSRGAHLAAA